MRSPPVLIGRPEEPSKMRHLLRQIRSRAFSLSLLRFIKSGHSRSIRTKWNIIAMFLLRGMGMCASFLIVPLNLKYLSQSDYGVWLTLSSFLGWMSLFDIGLGNGLRNKLAETRARADAHRAQVFVSTTYATIGIIAGAVYLVFLAGHRLLDWQAILNTDSHARQELESIVLLCFTIFVVRLVAGLINTIVIAFQRPALSYGIEILASFASLILMWILVHTRERASLLSGALALGVPLAVVPSGASLWLFARTYREVRPSLRMVDFGCLRELLPLGIRFFIIQIGGIAIFLSPNILITHLFSPAQVVEYNVAYKYYSILTILFAIPLAPFWSAYTEAYAQNDFEWVHHTIAVLRSIWMLLVLMSVVMSIAAAQFYSMWLGNAIYVPTAVSWAMGVYVVINCWCAIYVNFINGTGKVQLQCYAATAIAVLNIPLTIFLVKICGLGVEGVILGPIACLMPLCFLWKIQVEKILSGTARGIWNR